MKAEVVKQFPEIDLLIDEPLMNYTFTRTGGPVDVLAFPKNAAEAQSLVDYCREQTIPWMVLGNASNLIVRDGGIRGVVIMLTEMRQIDMPEPGILQAEAGAKLIDATYVALHLSLTGFEFACGIPGSVGGAVFMNAGAYDGEVKNVFDSADILFPDGSIRTLNNEEMQFTYRHSAIQDNGGMILRARFRLETGDQQAIKKRMEELTELRQLKQPLEYPSCGSVFKRPEGHFTGKLIQDAGLQGLKWGGAQISEKHAGFIVNVDNATATDYVELIAHIQKTIKEKFGVTLETEVRVIGEEA